MTENNVGKLETDSGEEEQEDCRKLAVEVTQLKQAVRQQQTLIENLMGELTLARQTPQQIVPKIPTTILSQPASPRSYLKPRDIPRLELSQLHGVETESFLTRFFDRVESCIPEREERLKVARSRLDIPLANLVQAEITDYRIQCWDTFKRVLLTQFKGSTNISELWRELGEEKYEVHAAPRAFANKLICKYSALMSRFPRDALPDRDQLIKKRLCQGLPRRTQSRLEDFLDSKMDLATFIDTVEFERSLILGQEEEGQMFKLSQEKEAGAAVVHNPVVGTRVDKESQDRFAELQKSLADLAEQIQKINTPPKNQWCGFCRTADHPRFKCPLNPSRGACFDCLRLGCRRGNRDCPGRSDRSNSVA